MGRLQALEVAFTVILMHIFVDMIMFRKLIFSKSEYLYHSANKSTIGNISTYNDCIHALVNDLITIRNAKFAFQVFQQPTILTYMNCLSCTPTACYSIDIERMFQIPNTSVHFTKSSLPFHISSQALHTLFVHGADEFFSFSSHFKFSTFDFSFDHTNLCCSTNTITSSIAFILFLFFVFSLFLFYKNLHTFPTKTFHYDICNNENDKKEFVSFFVILFFAHGFESFNESTRTLTVSDQAEFASINEYKNSALHVVIGSGVSEIPARALN